MNTKLIYEIISGKLLEILENQPKEITNFQQKLDTQIIELQKLLNNEQNKKLKNILELNNEYISLTNNFHLECGVEIGKKFAKLFND